MKYICVANCPELNDDQHCICDNIEDAYEKYVDGCPCGNKPIWKEMIQENTQLNSSYVPPASVKKEPNVDIHTAWRDGYETGRFEAIMDLTGGHKCKHAKGVIYCKDCRKHGTYACEMNYEMVGITEDDNYCSYAELKEEKNK